MKKALKELERRNALSASELGQGGPTYRTLAEWPLVSI